MRNQIEQSYRTESPAFNEAGLFFFTKCAFEAQNVHEQCALS